jgi:hypothetical protein
MSGSRTGGISYFVTAEELLLLGYLVCGEACERFESRIPTFHSDADWDVILQGLIEKNYVTKTADGVVFDRVIGVIVRLIGESKGCRIGSGERGRLFLHEAAVIWICEDERCAGRYRLVPMKSQGDFESSNYACELGEIEEVDVPWKKF